MIYLLFSISWKEEIIVNDGIQVLHFKECTMMSRTIHMYHIPFESMVINLFY